MVGVGHDLVAGVEVLDAAVTDVVTLVADGVPERLAAGGDRGGVGRARRSNREQGRR